MSPRLTILLTALATAVAALGFAAPIAVGSAQIFNGHTSSAMCAVGSDVTGGPFLATSSMIALSNRGGYVLTCQFQYPAGSFPSSQITVTGFACAIWPDPGLWTFDSTFKATPAGRATLVCRL